MQRVCQFRHVGSSFIIKIAQITIFLQIFWVVFIEEYGATIWALRHTTRGLATIQTDLFLCLDFFVDIGGEHVSPLSTIWHPQFGGSSYIFLGRTSKIC